MEPEPTSPNKIDVQAAISGILTQVMAMGANDSERSVLMKISKDHMERKISDEEALAMAEGVRDSKNAYH